MLTIRYLANEKKLQCIVCKALNDDEQSFNKHLKNAKHLEAVQSLKRK